MDAMVALYRSPTVLSLAHITKLNHALGESLCSCLVSQFASAEEDKWIKSARLTDKLLLRFLALTLIVNKFCVSSHHLDLLSKTFRRPSTWITKYFMQLGCRAVKEKRDKGVAAEEHDVSGHKAVILEIPFKFPAVKTHSRKN